MTSNEFKILFTGPMGAGKTTAITQLSDQECVSTDVVNTDLEQCNKEMTTAGLDYGYISLPDGSGVRLYGTPGQERFQFMWPILANNAAGVILLLNGEHPDLEAHLDLYTNAFSNNGETPLVIGIGRISSDDFARIDRVTEKLAAKHLFVPVISVDVRECEDVLLLVETLLCQIEANEMELMQV
ncbi:ATP-binding protein [uncultured Alcanivorax sp.]|uniref:GTP-binding protein n=1 Tax=uncultured Alcanivorax sp. TaxID=191215 RepID=UPI00261E5F2E|nr:ATP-binding protein [uncultured Alcanivorax sp.]